jgi:DeoR family galactitol utilization operon repressor
VKVTVILDSGSKRLLIAEALVRMTNITVSPTACPQRLPWRKIKTSPWWYARRATKRIRCTAHCRTFAAGICADLMFVGADGIDTNGITTFNDGYAISSVMAAAAHQVIAVLDASKFNRRGFNHTADAKIDCVITDAGAKRP